MNKRLSGTGLLILALAFMNVAAAETSSEEEITKSLNAIFPGVKPEISPSPMAGVSEVLIGPNLMYISNDGKYLLQGSLIDLKTRTDISEERRNGIRLAALDDLGEENMIIFPAKDQKHIITVFTDIDCGYCRKLHGEMDKYNEEGITVRYLMFPRAGIDSASYDKAVTVWCSKDKQDAMTRSKAGENLPKASCDNPVKEEYELGQLLGVRGTPAIITEDGSMLPGYVPAARLAKALEASN
ncbi:MAG: bifunctional protein-disulfide isomerase/oxidoreductase DsbC [Gammaproteobacteria bacterium]|jgi:thiol:disulfide interchange protein DsbC|nr:bifunctional protein-disulfide isomerase/oxidoreductase DsbC [Gammaproteobacteria bacterium]